MAKSALQRIDWYTMNDLKGRVNGEIRHQKKKDTEAKHAVKRKVAIVRGTTRDMRRQFDLEKCEPQSQHGSSGSAYFIARAAECGYARKCQCTVVERY
jgi:hypothetical protein